MSVRGYFTLRNAIPGYAFILIVIAINHVPLMEILQKPGFSNFFGAFLAFFYLLGGGAIGFLISQGWWWHWQSHAGILGDHEYDPAVPGDHEYDPAVEAFRDLYGVNIPPRDDMRGRRLFITAMDFADHTKIDKDHKALLTLAERRWDMFHTLSSTLIALVLGLVIGVSARFYFLLCLVPTPCFSLAELLALEAIIGSVIILMCLIYRGRIWTRQMSADLTEAIVRSRPVNPTTLRRVLPRLLFTQDNPRPDEASS